LCLASQSTLAQSTDFKSSPIQQQSLQTSLQTDDQDAAAVTFSGKMIVKSGNKFVLAGSDNLTTYQLDEQQRAQDFLNRVKVTGSLDASTGTIRIRAIDPA
jgi:hypothetical protein